METIIKKAIEGGYKGLEKPEYYATTVMEPSFWQALGKACGWDKPDRYWSVENDEGAITLIDVWENNAMTFHEINLTEGWDKAVAYLESLIK